MTSGDSGAGERQNDYRQTIKEHLGELDGCRCSTESKFLRCPFKIALSLMPEFCMGVILQPPAIKTAGSELKVTFRRLALLSLRIYSHANVGEKLMQNPGNGLAF